MPRWAKAVVVVNYPSSDSSRRPSSCAWLMPVGYWRRGKPEERARAVQTLNALMRDPAVGRCSLASGEPLFGSTGDWDFMSARDSTEIMARITHDGSRVLLVPRRPGACAAPPKVGRDAAVKNRDRLSPPPTAEPRGAPSGAGRERTLT